MAMPSCSSLIAIFMLSDISTLPTGAFLSGAGSSILALTDGVRGEPSLQSAAERCDALVAAAMEHAGESSGCPGLVRLIQPSTLGAHVVQTRTMQLPPLAGMRYVSTRGNGSKFSFEEVVMQGLATDGGLFVPELVRACARARMIYASNVGKLQRERVCNIYIYIYICVCIICVWREREGEPIFTFLSYLLLPIPRCSCAAHLWTLSW